LQEVPVLSRGAVLETVPGLVVTSHKKISAKERLNQDLLRGFNLDHRTDLATSVDGMPINCCACACQGYTDLIPLFRTWRRI